MLYCVKLATASPATARFHCEEVLYPAGQVVHIFQMLRAEGDRVDDAEMVDKEYNSVEAEFLPLQSAGSSLARNILSCRLALLHTTTLLK